MKEKSNIKVAFFLNFFFTIFEIIGGILTNSIALVSDAIHDLGDSLSLGVSWYLEHVSKKKPSKKFTYGYSRFSVLGGLITSIVLIVGIIFVFIEAIPRLIQPEEVNAPIVLLFAVFGVLVNGFAAYKTARGSSINEKVISLHLLEDVFGWAVLLVVSGIMTIWNIPILDPILSLLYSLVILFHVLKNIKKIGFVFLEGFESDMDQETIKHKLMENELVKDVHHIHYWTLDGSYHMMTCHVQLESLPNCQIYDELMHHMKHQLSDLGFDHVTIEVEYHKCVETDCNPQVDTSSHHHHHH